MPAVRTYIVTQEIEVRVSAESPTAAIGESRHLLQVPVVDESFRNVRSDPREIEIRAREEF